MSVPKTTKKPKKGFVVPSRYMKASTTYSSQPSSSQDTRLGVTSSWDKTATTCSSYGDKKSSTPSSLRYSAQPSINESVIPNVSSILSPSGGAKLKEKKISSTSSVKKKSFQSVVDPEKEITLLYADYLQAKLLESKATSALEKRSKFALEKIYTVWCLMQRLIEANEAAKKELNFISYLSLLNDHLKKQEKILLPVLQILPSLNSQYEAIAKAVHTVKHKLEVKGIILKDNDSEEIAELVSKATNFLNEMLRILENCTEIIVSASAADNLINQGQLLTEEIRWGAKLLSEVNDLLLDETPLQL